MMPNTFFHIQTGICLLIGAFLLSHYLDWPANLPVLNFTPSLKFPNMSALKAGDRFPDGVGFSYASTVISAGGHISLTGD